jgi:hypothetical protein
MVNRLSALWLVLGAIGGYALAGTSVTAQGSPLPFLARDNVTLTFEHGTYEGFQNVECVVDETQGTWVKCARQDRFGSAQRDEHWYSLRRVVEVTKHAK